MPHVAAWGGSEGFQMNQTFLSKERIPQNADFRKW